MKTIIISLMIVLALVPIASSGDCDNPITALRWSECQGETPKPVQSESFGGWRTKTGWNGEQCVPRDLVTKPVKIKNPQAFLGKPFAIFRHNGDYYAFRVWKGEKAYVRQGDMDCDKSVLDYGALPRGWWMNNYNDESYFQFDLVQSEV